MLAHQYNAMGGVSPDGRVGGLIVRDASSAGDLLRPPTDFVMIFMPGPDAVLWRPVPPEGYVALGDVMSSQGKPPPETVMCVKKSHRGRSYVQAGEIGDTLVHVEESAAFSVIKPPLYPVDDTDEHLYLPTGAFTFVHLDGGSGSTPGPTPVTYVLDLPAVLTTGPGLDKPKLTSYKEPPAAPVVTDRVFTVPYNMVKDDDRSEKWKVDNSPFYTLTRQRTYNRIFWHDNQQGSETQHDGRQVTTGVTKDSSQTFSTRTGVTVGAEVGVEVGAEPFGVGVKVTSKLSVSASLELGYERRYGVSVMEEVTKTHDLYTAPHSCGALWLEQHTLFPTRGDGSLVSSDSVLDFDVDDAVTGEYPPEAGVRHTERLVITADAADVDVPARRTSPTDSSAGMASRPVS